MQVAELKISLEKKQPLVKKDEVVLTLMGIEGDRHADGGEKQISVYSTDAQEIDKNELKGLCYQSYEANILLSGIDLKEVKAGDIITIGDDNAKIMITSHKGKCFDNCEKYNAKLYCTLRVSAVYAKVITPGVIKTGDSFTLQQAE